MIIDREIKLIKKGLQKKTLDYYKSIGYDLSGDFFIVDVNDLHKNSLSEILVKCDFCFMEKYCKYYKYNLNISNSGKYSCSMKCGRVKSIDTNLKKYGVDNPSKSKIIKEKVKKTNLEKFGTDSYSKTDEYKNRVKETNLENWGVDNPSKSNKIKNKKKNTNLERWGVDNPFKSVLIKNKIKETNLEKYGVDNYTKTSEYREKTKKTNLEKYGVDSYTKTSEYREKTRNTSFQKWGEYHYSKTDNYKESVKKTNLERWGVEWALQNKEIRDKGIKTFFEKWGFDSQMKSDLYRNDKFKITSDPNYIKYISNGNSLFKCDNNKDHTFIINNSNYHHRKEKNILCTECYPISKTTSLIEIQLFEIIKLKYLGEVIQSYRDVLEIDIYLPELKLGFELNGLYWHSEKFVDKNYHKEKTNYFKEKGIRIIHIWEDDWINKNEIIKSQISNLIGTTKNKIFARKCEIREVNLNECRDFLNNNHTQGYVNSKIKIGLYYNNELVSLMTFNQFEEIDNNLEWNLNSFCNKLETIVIGGASKLLSYFIKTYSPKKIVSYADLDWSQGNLYYKLGFNLINESKPDYKYLCNKNRVNKSNLNIFESIDKIWDCGKLKFEMIIQI